MRLYRTLFLASAVALAAACSQHGNPQSAPLDGGRPTDADDGSVHPVEAKYWEGIAAFNSHDLDAFMQQWDDDIHMYAADAGWLRGKAAVRDRFQRTFDRFPSVRMEIDDLRVREVAPGAATVEFRYRVFPRGSGPAFHGVGSGVYVLRNGRWVEVMEHESITRIDPELRAGT